MSASTKLTVGVIGTTGTLGGAIYKALTTQPVNVVILHRPTTKLVGVAEKQARTLDMGGPRPLVHKALEGIDILVNASSRTDPATDLVFLDHLASLPKPLKAYIPSDFSLNYSRDEVRGIQFIEGKEALVSRARELGIPTTAIHNGVFESVLLTPFTGIDLVTGTLSLYPGAEDKALPITSPAYLGAAVAEIVQLETLKAHYTVLEYAATGREIGAALEKARKKVSFETWTDEEAAALKALGGREALSSTVRVKWGKGEWPAPGEYIPKAPKRDIHDAVKHALAKLP
ncbi:hypothetical protein CspeluHIS016_0301460 [Cutaneotrichosporon spelunceum]|uniref:NmrA-like domain-containing protein n=1 Tax=Cutaneotrichosporon spelunceum TaxID=1672016 RepID=A0AAD3TSX4_9TREE|nr:hypothetical protein CspeluHIS016_0301460 [Cutaneotrichosporon spelunceum]